MPVLQSVEVGLDVEDIQVVASGKQSRFRMTDVSSRPPSLQAARQYLLSYSSKKRTDCSLAREQLSSSQSKTSTVGYRNVEQMSCHSCMKRLSSGSAGSSDSSSITSSLSSASSSSSSMSSAASSPSLTVTKNLKPAKKLEDMDQRRAGQQFLLFRRLYSELEREKVRRVRQQRNQSKKMECIKKKKETERRLVEEEMGAPNAVQDSLLSTDTTEDRQQVEKWQELLADEARKQELQRVKEVERYILALKAQLRDKMERKKVTVSPLCFCGETIWDTDPQKCANNCTFHKNSQGMVCCFFYLLLFWCIPMKCVQCIVYKYEVHRLRLRMFWTF